ncbi:MAG: SIMPL domain-containing protein [Candidatus Pacebacteria bacterium]|nr:SIMPL domain-containing protein [Candidatus Paceibacterota bacterium]
MEISPEQKVKLYNGLKIALIVFLAVVVANALFDCRGDRDEDKTPNTISFSGHGEVTAVPDIANIYFTISQDAKTVKDAQTAVATIEKKALDLLKAKGVADKDIQTANASFNPKYQYQNAVCPPVPVGAGTAGIAVGSTSPSYCPPGRQVLVGYTANESITVKIRNIDSVGDIMQGLGTTGVSDLNGPNFAIDKEDSLKAEARKKAIDDAKAKAKVLAKDLGVRLGKITSFSENGNTPIMYTASAMMKDSAGAAPAPAVIPKGENTISSDVTITYEIR